MFPLDDTIVAIASAPGGAARGIVRLSGPRAIELAENFFSPTVRDSGDASVAKSIDGTVSLSGRKVPSCLMVWPTKRSYTRQPVAELHTLGSPPILEAIVQSLCSVGARLAQPGEFTLRAFLAGRIDLTQAEAVLGVIDAVDRRQLQTALTQLAGGFSEPLLQLRSDLLNLLADLEAGLDFTEEDIRFISVQDVLDRVSVAVKTLQRLAAQLGERSIAGRLPRVALVGPPNAGKSSLFNALVGDSAAIVSPQAGTTRDYLVAVIDAEGLQVELVDTAGVADGSQQKRNVIDQTAESSAIQQRVEADLSLICHDARDKDLSTDVNDRSLVVITKIDLLPSAAGCSQTENQLLTSSKTGHGLLELRSAIRRKLDASKSGPEVISATAVRARESVRAANESLNRVQQLVQSSGGDELASAELHIALAELGKIVGAVYTDDLLDRIFSRFCIGK